MSTVKATKSYVILAGLIAILAASFVTYPLFAQDDDTRPPTFVSATTNSAGENVIVTFSEDVTVPQLVSTVAQQFGLPIGLFLKAVLTVTVDGHMNLPPTSASLSGSQITLRLESPAVQSGQEVKVAYDNVFAKDADLIVDAAGNEMSTFSAQTVTNISTIPSDDSFIPGPVVSPDELTIAEGESGTYQVTLPSQPTGEVTVSIISAIETVAVASPASLTFNQDNWNQAQTVTVTTSDDSNTYNAWVVVSTNRDDVSSDSTYGVYVWVLIEDQD